MGISSDLVIQWFDRVWNNGESKYIDEALCPECELTGLDSETIKSPEDFHRFHQMLNSIFKDINIGIDHLTEDGDTFAGVVSVQAIHRSTEKPINFQSSFFGTFKEGQIYKVTNLVDYLSVLIQLGALPTDAIAQGLTGETTLKQCMQ